MPYVIKYLSFARIFLYCFFPQYTVQATLREQVLPALLRAVDTALITTLV